MTGHLLSLNMGSPEPMDADGQLTGIHKVPVDVLEVRPPGPKHGGLGSGVVGDYIGSPQHHGGDDQALYAVAREELDVWGARLGRDLPSGMFGENLTTSGLDIDAAFVGDRWRLGDEVMVEVTGPRIPCATFAWRMGVKGWVRIFAERGRTGTYLRVVEAGRLRRGDRIEVVERPHHGVTVPMVFRAFMGDLELAGKVLEQRVLNPDEHAALERRVAARTRRVASVRK